MSEDTNSDAGGTEALAAFSAEALDWPAVRARLERLALSGLGRRALRRLGPREDADARAALQRGRELLALLRAGEEPPLAGTPDPLPHVEAALAYGRAMEGEGLADVARFLRVAQDLGAWVRARADRAVACGHLFGDLPDLTGLRAELDATVDRKGRVLDDASPRLAELRARIKSLGTQLDRLLRELANKPGLRGALAEGHAGQVHRRAGRRVLAVRQRNAGQVPGIVHDRSASGETLFIEPRGAVELANRLAGAEADAGREVARLLAEKTRAVLDAREELEAARTRVAELELGSISAQFARATGGGPARLPGEPGAAPGLLLRGWRHPLLLAEQEAGALDDVTPIDLRIGGDFSLVVITGPNTGGKTLALKGAGLAALLTRLGLAIPAAEGSTVPLYRAIAADIGDEQEIQQNLSTFSSHLVRIRAALEAGGEGVLVLLDELGGGTDPSEGAALGEVFLERLLASGAHTLASTHLGQLKEFAFRHEGAENAHVEFDVETLAPLYTVVIGAPGESHAIEVARRYGIDGALVERARERCRRPDGEAASVMDSMRELRVEAERLRAEAEERVLALEEEARELERKRDAVAARSERVEEEAQALLEERLRGAREWVERIGALAGRLDGAARAELEPLTTGLREALAEAALSDRRREFLTGLKKGATVWLPKYRKRCSVTRLRREKRELVVRLGKHELTVSFDDVTPYLG